MTGSLSKLTSMRRAHKSFEINDLEYPVPNTFIHSLFYKNFKYVIYHMVRGIMLQKY